MRIYSVVAFSAVLSICGSHGSRAADEPLSSCFDAVGTFLTTNTNPASGNAVGRSLISLTNGGHIFLTDSNEGGEAGFAPFTEGRGAWRCASDEAGEVHILATVLDFTHKTEAFPEQKVVRLDYDATYDEASGAFNANVKLYFMPMEADPMDRANLGNPILNQIRGVKVTAR